MGFDEGQQAGERLEGLAPAGHHVLDAAAEPPLDVGVGAHLDDERALGLEGGARRHRAGSCGHGGVMPVALWPVMRKL